MTKGILREVAEVLASPHDLQSTLQTIMEKMAKYYHPDTWSLLRVDEEKNELYFALVIGDAGKALENVRLKVGEGLAGWVARYGECVIVPDVTTDPRFAKRLDEMKKWETRSIICVPLRSRRRVLGLIQLVNVKWKTFGTQELFCIRALCDYAAIAIEGARCEKSIH